MKTVTRDRLEVRATRRAIFLTRRHTFLLAGFGLLMLVIVHHSNSRVSQCNQLVAIINQAAEARPDTAGMTIAEDNRLLLRTAIKLDGYADDLAMMEFSNQQLQGLQMQFVKLYRDMSKANSAVVNAPVNNFQIVRQANKAFIETQERESPLVREVNQYCRSEQRDSPSI